MYRTVSGTVKDEEEVNMDMGQGFIATTQELNDDREARNPASWCGFFVQGLGRSQPCDGIGPLEWARSG